MVVVFLWFWDESERILIFRFHTIKHLTFLQGASLFLMFVSINRAIFLFLAFPLLNAAAAISFRKIDNFSKIFILLPESFHMGIEQLFFLERYLDNFL